MTTLLECLGVFCKYTAEEVLALLCAEVKTGVVVKVGLCETNFYVVLYLYQCGEEDETFLVELREVLNCVLVLERVEEL